MDGITEKDVDRRKGRKLPQRSGDTPGRCNVILGLVLDLELDHVQHSIWITGEDAGPAGAVHGLLEALPALAVMVTVNDSAAKLRADLVELVAEMSHLVGAVFITRDDFVDGVNDDGHVIRFLRPGNDFGR